MNTLRERALARRNKVKTASVQLPWGEDGQLVPVHVRTITAAQRDELEAQQVALNKSGNATSNFRGRLVALAACDEHGNPLFSAQDAQAIGDLPSDEVNKLFAAAVKLNGLSAEDQKELEGN